MANIFDVPSNELIEKTAVELKKIDVVIAPEWASYVKTGAHKERPPARKDWWHIKAASVLRTICKLGPIGVSKLRTRYGGKKNRGVKPEKFCKASGNILRKILQQLEKAELVKQEKRGNHKGRVITPKGKSFLDKIATQILSTKPKVKKISKLPKHEKSEKKKEEVKKKVSKEEVKKEVIKKQEKEVKKDAPKEEKHIKKQEKKEPVKKQEKEVQKGKNE